MTARSRRISASDSYSRELLALFPKIRGALLKAIFTRPKKWFYMSQLAAQLGTSPSALQREFPLLIDAGILQRREDQARRVYVRASKASPVYKSLLGLFAPHPSSAHGRGSLKLLAKYDRQKLYEQVWTQPRQKLAKEYGVSDSMLGRVCRKLRIPAPGRGDWAKIAAGKSVGSRPPLPPLAAHENSPSASVQRKRRRQKPDASHSHAHTGTEVKKMRLPPGKVMLCPVGHRTTIPAKDRKRKIVCPICGQGARSLNYFLEKARQGGRRGGKARAARLSAEQRRESARNAVLARWAKRKNQETAAITDIAAA